MIFVAVFFAAVAMVFCAADDTVTTSLLLPDALFVTGENFAKPTFVGQVTVTKSTTWYTLDGLVGGAASYFVAGDNSYTFFEIPASTQYTVENSKPTTEQLTAASSTIDQFQYMEDTLTINCGPLGTSSSAFCTTTSTEDGEDTSSDSLAEPQYTTNIESALYAVIFTQAVSYGATSTSAAPSSTFPAPTAKPTIGPSDTASFARSSLGPSYKLGIALGAPLGACALAGVAYLLYRHGKHKERSRTNQLGNLAPPAPFASESESKRVSDVGVGGQTMMGRSPPVYSMEMQG